MRHDPNGLMRRRRLFIFLVLALASISCGKALPSEPNAPQADPTPAAHMVILLTCSDGSTLDINNNSATTCPAGTTPVSMTCSQGGRTVTCP